MNNISLTDKQLAVIHHPIGKHARVLAVAGSGKGFTMACRIQHLVQECRVAPHAIRVLMFNRLAREQLRTHLERTGLPDIMQPEVHTFHSFSFQVINTMVRIGVLPGLTQFWTGEKEELVWLTTKRAIESLERKGCVPPNTIEVEDALNAISLWKGALLLPERAGSWSSPSFVRLDSIYDEVKQKLTKTGTDKVIDLLMDMHTFSEYYIRLINPEIEDNKEIQVRLKRLNRWEIKTAYPFLLNVYHDFCRKKICSEFLSNTGYHRILCNTSILLSCTDKHAQQDIHRLISKH